MTGNLALPWLVAGAMLPLLGGACTDGDRPASEPTDTDSGADSGADSDTDSDSGDPGAADTGDPPSDTGDTGGGADTGDPPEDPVDYREDGEYAVSVTTATHAVAADCDMDVRLYTPSRGEAEARLLLAHGFSRGPEQMAGWASHLAGWGIEVGVPSLCRSSAWNVDHEGNGQDLVALNEALGGGAVIYAGHSAGGLAALVAGATDPAATAVITLDLTDSDDLGLSTVDSLAVPLYGLVGEPSYCNNEGNGVDVLERAPEVRALRVTEADHCDFENETDWMCTWFCSGSNDRFSDEELQATVGGLLTAAAVDLGGAGAGIDHWWTAGGTYYEALLDNEAIQEL